MTVHKLFSKFVRVETVPRICPCYIGLGCEVLMGVRADTEEWVNKIYAYVQDPEGDGWRPVYKTLLGRTVFVDTDSGDVYNVNMESCKTSISFPPKHADVLSTMV